MNSSCPSPTRRFILDVVWQSSLFLLAGLAGGAHPGPPPRAGAPGLAAGDRGCPDHAAVRSACAPGGLGALDDQPTGCGFSDVARSAASTVSPAALPANGVQNRTTAASRRAMSSVKPLPDAIPPRRKSPREAPGARRAGEARSGSSIG